MDKDWSVDETINQIKHLLLEKDAEIVRLREEVKRYKPVLLQIVRDYPEEGDVDDYWYWRAREALQMKEGE